MKHLTEQDLILLHYGEPQNAEIKAHLQTCAVCRKSLEILEKDLGALDEWQVPARPDNYGQQVWEKLAPKLELENSPTGQRNHAVWLWVPAVAALIILAFLIGRNQPAEPWSIHPEKAQNRVLNDRLTHHLEQTTRVLTQVKLTNAVPQQPEAEPDNLRWLLRDNRIYRRVLAQSQTKPGLEVLEELEFLLLRLNHANAGPALPADLDQDVAQLLPKLRQLIDRLGLNTPGPQIPASQF